MSNALTFILKLQDMLTPSMRQAAAMSNTSAAKIEGEFAKISAGGKKMGASVNELHARLDAINKVRFSTTLEKEFNVATKAAQKLENQIAKLDNKGSKGAGVGSMLGGFVKGNLIAGAITQGVGMLKDFAGDVNATSLKSSSLSTAINSTTGGQGAAAVSQTDAIANKYGLNYEASLEGVKTLTGGLKSMNMPLAEQMKIFEGVSTGISAMKLGAEEGKGAMLALGQMASKGVVSAEELRGQLGERIPGAFGIAAKAMNVTEAELGKMMQKGEIASKDFLPKFAAEMQKTFGADALAAANGPAAVQERFTNAMFKMKASIGEGLMPVITPVVEKLTALAVEVLPYIQQGIQFVIDLFSDINNGTSEWSVYIDVIRTHFGNLWTTIKSLGANIWNIVSGIAEWFKKSEMMQDLAFGIGKVFGVVLTVIRGIGDTIQWIWNNIIKPILDAIEWVYSKTKALFGGGKSEVVITDNTKSVLPYNDHAQMQLNPTNILGAPVLKNVPYTIPGVPVNPVNANGVQSPKTPADVLGGGGKDAKGKSESINSGGQRSIIVNIAKQIEKLEVHVLDAKGGADEIESMVREAMRRVMYSINGVATS